jgi:hypothetical protein
MGIIHRKKILEAKRQLNAGNELPPLAKEVVERERFVNSPDVPSELPTISDISRHEIREAPRASEDGLSHDSEVHEVKERLGRIESMLKSAGAGKFLNLRDGKVIHNLSDLRAALVSMSSDTFNYHVNFERNDFAAWILNVFGDKALSEKVDSSTSKAQLIRVLNEHFD